MEADNDNLVQKTCTKCGEAKPLSAYYKQSAGKFGVTSRCKSCCSIIAAEHYKNNRDDILRRNAEWTENNREKHKSIMASWYVNNKERAQENIRRWKEENPVRWRELAREASRRRSKVPGYLFECAVKTAVRKGLVKGSKYGRRTFDLLGYTVEQLRAHLERQFQPGMSWENYGEWHIDHVIPLSAHNYETPDDIDFKKAWELSNLQPLWAFDNMSKKDRLDAPFQPSLAISA